VSTKTTAKAFLSNRVENGPDSVQLNFYADYADGKNKEWAVNTPTLSLSMTVRKDVAEKQFPVDVTSYTITFEASEKEEANVGNSTA